MGSNACNLNIFILSRAEMPQGQSRMGSMISDGCSHCWFYHCFAKLTFNLFLNDYFELSFFWTFFSPFSSLAPFFSPFSSTQVLVGFFHGWVLCPRFVLWLHLLWEQLLPFPGLQRNNSRVLWLLIRPNSCSFPLCSSSTWGKSKPFLVPHLLFLKEQISDLFLLWWNAHCQAMTTLG